MKKELLFAMLLTLLAFIFVPVAQAQYFKFDNAQQIEDEVDAILKFFGSVVGGGMFHTADIHSVTGFDFGFRGVVAVVPNDFNNLASFSEENIAGLGFLHGSVGLPGDFELFGRFFYMPIGSDFEKNPSPQRAADSRGGVTLIGGGIKYGLFQKPGLPKVMLMGAYHALFVPEEFDFGTVGTLSFKGVASYSIPLFSIYAGAGIDITSLKLNDAFLNGERFTATEPHVTIGAKVSPFPLIHINGSYNISEFPSIDLGIGVSFR